MVIGLVLKRDGETVAENARIDKYTLDLDEVCEIAEGEVMCGKADYACVTVDGEIYMELEA